jgi:nitrogen fixation NifU-like protein
MTHLNIEQILTKNFIDHFSNPRNIGEIENADGYAKVGDPSCGDFIKVWIKVKDEIITDYKFKVFGCGGAIATTSIASELAIGKRLKEAIKLTDDDVILALGGIPDNKKHCSLLGINGLRAAIANYLVKDNHRKYIERIEKYRQAGYDIPAHRNALVQHLNGLAKDAEILDVGTGKGHLALAIARKGFHCKSIDISKDEIYYAQLNAIYYGMDEKIELIEQDAQQMKFQDNSFDAVLCADMIHHLEQPELVLSEMCQVCKSGGMILISDINDEGQRALKAVFQQEGREHVRLGWSMERVKEWFEGKARLVETFDLESENILKITL